MAFIPDPSEIDLLFAYAAHRGLAGPRARQAFDRGVDAGWGLTVFSPYGLTALGAVCQHDQPALASRLLRAGAEPELRDANHLTPLSLAVAYQATDCAFLLLAHGADPNTCTVDAPVITRAAAAGSAALVRGLARSGANLDLRNASGSNALMCAASCGYQSIVRTLIRLGAPLDSVNADGHTALILSAQRGYHSIFFDLLHKANPLIRGHDGLGATEVLADLGARTRLEKIPAMAAALRKACADAEAREFALVSPEVPRGLRRAVL